MAKIDAGGGNVKPERDPTGKEGVSPAPFHKMCRYAPRCFF